MNPAIEQGDPLWRLTAIGRQYANATGQLDKARDLIEYAMRESEPKERAEIIDRAIAALQSASSHLAEVVKMYPQKGG
jgi:acyl-CoA reductase-like NAD-dependent aldehyde dehydrogenase